MELTRDIAERFNSRYGETLIIPSAAIPKVAARVMDLQEPKNKMSKSSESANGTIGIFEDPTSIAKKFNIELDAEHLSVLASKEGFPLGKIGEVQLGYALDGVADAEVQFPLNIVKR